MICHIHCFFQTDGKEKEVDLQYIPGVMGPPGPQVTINCCHIIITTTQCLFDLIPVVFVFFSKGTSGDTWTTSETMTYMFIMRYPSYKLQCTLHLPGRKVNSLFLKLCRENLVYQVFQVRKVKKVKEDERECQG